MLLKDLFKEESEVVTISSDDRIIDATRKMQEENVGSLVVTENRKVVGIVTDRDIALSVVLGAGTEQSFVNEIMSKDVKTIRDDQGIFNATQYFQGYKIRRLPVVDKHDNLVGMVSTDDLLAFFTREMFNVCKALEPALGHRV